jgi:hypothetical protein
MDNETNINPDPSRNAVSVYRAEGPMDDFPVLKAFQQYIDSEQNKARKRLVTLCVFFGAMICVVIAVFMVMLHDINQRNQLLNDRLVEFAMKDRDRVPVVVQQPVAPAHAAAPANTAATEAALKAMTETLVALQKQLAERHEHGTAATPPPAPSAAQAVPAVPQAASAPTPAAEEAEIERKERLARERIRKERAQLAEERRKLAEERERRHQEEVERHRRRLYPEYYAAKDKEASQANQPQQPAQQPAKREISDDDIADILREAAISAEEEEAKPAAAPAQQPVLKDEQQPERKKGNDDVTDAIEYFSDDEYEIPVEVKGSSAKWRVPLD